MNVEYDFKQELRAVGLLSRRVLSSGFGQNFLLGEEDRNLVARYALDNVNLCNNKFTIIEIGAGPGGLTKSLFVEGARKVIAIEQDRQFIPMLNKLSGILPEGKKLDVIMMDARKLDFANVASSTSAKGDIIIVGNLPYSAATAILQNILYRNIKFHSMTLMFQKEVAERICAKLGEKSYSRLSILVSLRYGAETCCDFAPQAFFPVPKVFSRLLRFKLLDDNEMGNVSKDDYETVSEMTSLLFTYRRKRISTILRKVSSKNNSYDLSNWQQAGEDVGVDFSKRPENIDTKMWLAWARKTWARKTWAR